jgi:superoxide dismutase, Cu-Zn family
MRMSSGTRATLAGSLGLGVIAVAGVAAAGTGFADTGPGTAVTPASAGVGATVATADTTGSPSDEPTPSRRTRHVRAVLHDVNGNRVGLVDITALRHGGNEVSVQAWNLTPGFHGFHIHSVGICDPAGPKPFASAGGHFNPGGTPEGMQAGAFPVLLAGADGRARAEFVDANFTIAQLAGPTGAAIVVHAAPDNYANIPTRYLANGVPGPDAETQMTGDSGARVACAVVFPAATPSATPSETPTETDMPGMTDMPSTAPTP